MQGTLVVPGRGRFAVGQASPLKDMDHVFTTDELNKIVFEVKSADEALSAWKYLTRASALLQKLAFVSELKANVDRSAGVRDFLASSASGQNFYSALSASHQAFMGLSMPNLMRNVNILRGVLEIQVLLTKFGQGVKGRMPMYQKGAIALSWSDVDTGGASAAKTIFNFGDLTKTSMNDDLKAMDENVGAFGQSVKTLGELTTAAIIVIVIGSVIVASLLTASVFKWVDGPSIKVPPMPPGGVDPAAWAEFLKKFNQAEESFGKTVKDILTLLIIGLGVITVGGTVYYIATRD